LGRLPEDEEPIYLGNAFLQLRFLCLHELAHIALSHLDNLSATPAVLPYINFPIARYNESQLMEFEADRLAAKVLIESYDDPGNNFQASPQQCLFAIDTFFSFVAFIARATQIMNPSTLVYGNSHLALERANELRKAYPAAPEAIRVRKQMLITARKFEVAWPETAKNIKVETYTYD
jgi:hypothetical protein